MSFDEVRNRQPSLTDSVIVKKRSSFDISMNGGNDYKIESPDKNVTKTLKREAWAYSDGDTLYINCRQYKAQIWYAKVLSYGDYLLFDAGLSELTKNEGSKTVAMGVAGGATFGAIQGAREAKMRFPYAINVSTNTLHLITIDFIGKVMKKKGDAVFGRFLHDKETIRNIRDAKQKEIATNNLINKYIPLINAE